MPVHFNSHDGVERVVDEHDVRQGRSVTRRARRPRRLAISRRPRFDFSAATIEDGVQLLPQRGPAVDPRRARLARMRVEPEQRRLAEPRHELLEELAAVAMRQVEPRVARDSDVETYCALRVHIDSWRWNGVPWYVRSGKCLPVTACEVLVRLKAPPQNLFEDSALREEANYLRFRLSPHSTIALAARVKRAGKEFLGDQREFALLDEQPGEQTPYQRLLTDAMNGDGALFAREASIEAAWAVVQPVLDDHPASIIYAPGSWGPAAANHFIAADGGWRNPEPAS